MYYRKLYVSMISEWKYNQLYKFFSFKKNRINTCITLIALFATVLEKSKNLQVPKIPYERLYTIMSFKLVYREHNSFSLSYKGIVCNNDHIWKWDVGLNNKNSCAILYDLWRLILEHYFEDGNPTHLLAAKGPDISRALVWH